MMPGARRYGGVAYRSNDARLKGVGSIFGPGFSEELPRAAGADVRALNNDVSDPDLVS